MFPDFVHRSMPRDHLGDSLESSLGAFISRPHPVGFAATPKWRPPTDVFETPDAFYVVMDLAGMNAEEITIETEGDVLTVSGVRPDRAHGVRHYHAMEIQVGPFERRIQIGRRVDASAIQASYDRGYLEIRLPKLPESSTGPRQVPIR